MEKHPITSAVIIAIVAAFLGEFGSRGLDAMSNFIITKGLCEVSNGGCLFIFQFSVLIFFYCGCLLRRYACKESIKLVKGKNFTLAPKFT